MPSEQTTIPPGYALVPVEPTEAMLAAGRSALWKQLGPKGARSEREGINVTTWPGGCETDALIAWRAMMEVARAR
jgi:hypothetical protein